MRISAAFVTFTDGALYPWYAAAPRHSVSPLDDQRLGGLLMWIPGNLWIFGAIGIPFPLVEGGCVKGARSWSQEKVTRSGEAEPRVDRARLSQPSKKGHSAQRSYRTEPPDTGECKSVLGSPRTAPSPSTKSHPGSIGPGQPGHRVAAHAAANKSQRVIHLIPSCGLEDGQAVWNRAGSEERGLRRLRLPPRGIAES